LAWARIACSGSLWLSAEGLAVNRGYAANGPCHRQEADGVHLIPSLDCCPHATGDLALSGTGSVHPADLPGAGLAERVGHLYECRGLSTYRIAAIVGIDRQRVGRLLHRAGVAVKPRGVGRPRPPGDALVALAAIMEDLYVRRRLASAQVAALTGVPERTVRGRLTAGGVVLRTRGRCNREDRLTVAAEELTGLYVELGLSAAETGRLLGVSGQVVLRAAHDQGVPVRVGGPASRRGPAEIELVDALYADLTLRRALDRHGVRRVPAGAPISLRFPVPQRLGPELAAELYSCCGLGLRHIELLTGQPAETVRALLRSRGIALRPAGGRSPFLRRWRAATRNDGLQG
jgi:hypothetical protein